MKRFTLFLLLVLATCVGVSSPAFAAKPDSVAVSHLAVLPMLPIDSAARPMPAMRATFPDARALTIPGRATPLTHPTLPTRQHTLVLSLAGLALIGAVKTTAADKDSKFALDSVRQQFNKLVADFNYFLLNRPAWQVAAAAVAPPVCATATVTSQVKTTATTQLFLNGVPKSLTATDNLWTLTGATLAAGFFRRYLLCWDGSSATTVVSVIASSDAATAAGCTWSALPPAGTGIVGILTIQNVTNPFIPATTLLGAAGVTATYIDGIDDSIIQAAQVTP